MSLINGLEKAEIYQDSIGKQWIDSLNLFKPIWYFDKEDCQDITYYRWITNGYPQLWSRFTSNNLGIRSYRCKEGLFLVGHGSIFMKEVELFESYTTLFLICEDNKKVVFLINPKINTIKGLKSKIDKFIKSNPWKADIIWTDNPDEYCFRQETGVRFKTFVEQRSYFQHVADEWLKAEKLKNKSKEEEKVEAF